MTTIYLVRHAEAEGNAYRRIHGQYDSLVTPNGLRQIAALEKRFEQIHIDACYASDLYRTRKTAQAVYVPKRLPLQTDARLREVNLGRWEDVPFGYLERFEQEAMYQFNHDEKNWSVEGSETWQQYTDRFLAAMTEAAEAHAGRTIAIFSHGCVLRGVQKRIAQTDWVPYCDNTAVSKLRYENGAFCFEFLNDNSHLPEEISTFARQKWWRKDAGKDYNMWFRAEEDRDAAMCGDAAVGFVRVREDVQGVGWIDALGMDEAHRGKGYGVQLIGQAVSRLRAAGKSAVRAEVAEMNPQALRFFTKHGFSRIEEKDGIAVLEKEITVPKG